MRYTGTMAAQEPGKWAALRGNVLAVGVVSLLTDLSAEMIHPLLPVFIAGMVPVGSAPIVLGAMEGLAEAAASLLKIASGSLSDRLGKRKALVLVGYGLSTLARPARSGSSSSTASARGSAPARATR
jgi:nitrate/nitrite transporter NarK